MSSDCYNEEMLIPFSKERVKKLPGFIGVYVFLKKNKPIYIGKSLNVKARILSHLENSKFDQKEKIILANCDHLECFVTDSEFKALLLESKLIKIHHPRYNVRWKDDKNYLYLKVTQKEAYPKVLATRKESEKNVKYFGPFPSVQSVNYILREIRKVFPFCTQSKIGRSPCFYSKIGLCNPCPSAIEKVKDLKTKADLVKIYKKNIRNVIRILEGKTQEIEKKLIEGLKKLIKEERYEEAIELRGRLFYFQRLIYQQFKPQEEAIYNQSQIALGELKKILKPYFPKLSDLQRIECFDVSNLLMQSATASMVVVQDGNMAQQEYRKFKIKDPKLKSDFEMIEETLNRRFKNKWPYPNLIVIDGGRPQVHRVMEVIKKNRLSIPAVGIAKHPDRLIAGVQGLPRIRIGERKLGFNLVRRLRDESHRFAKKYHLLLRDKSFLSPKRKYN